MRLFDARLKRIADRRRKAHTGPVNIQVVYYEVDERNGETIYTDAQTGETLSGKGLRPVAIVAPGMWERLMVGDDAQS